MIASSKTDSHIDSIGLNPWRTARQKKDTAKHNFYDRPKNKQYNTVFKLQHMLQNCCDNCYAVELLVV